MKTGLLLLELLGTGALVLVVISGTKSGNAKTQSQLDQATTFRHIGIIVFGVLYFAIVGATTFCWINRQTILKYRRKVYTHGPHESQAEPSLTAYRSHH